MMAFQAPEGSKSGLRASPIPSSPPPAPRGSLVCSVSSLPYTRPQCLELWVWLFPLRPVKMECLGTWGLENDVPMVSGDCFWDQRLKESEEPRTGGGRA